MKPEIKTLAMVVLDLPYRAISKRTMAKRWFDDHAHTRVALEQGALFCNILREARAR